MPKDKTQVGQKTSGAMAHLFFWPGQDELADHLAEDLAVQKPMAFDPIAVTAALRTSSAVVVLWRGPDADLAPCLISGNPIADALEDWKDKARQLAVLYRKNRRTMILAEGEALRSAGTEALAERLGLTEAPSLPQIDPPSPLGQALTHMALDQDEDLRLLVDEMVSSSLPVPEPDMAYVLAQAVAQVAHAGRNLSAKEDALDGADRLRRQLEADIAEAASARATAEAAATHKISALESQVSVQEDAISTLSSDAAALRASLEERTVSAQSAAKRATDYIRTLEGQISQQEAAIATLSSEADALRTALEEKGTEADLLRGQIALNDSALLKQSEAAAAALAESAAQIEALQGKLSQQDAVFKERLEESEAQAEILRNQLDLKQSLLIDQSASAQAARAEAAAAEEANRALAEECAKQTVLAAELADKASDVEVLSRQVMVLQEGLSQVVTSAAEQQEIAARAPASGRDGELTPRTDAWDKALAKALSAARSEAELRAKLEQDLQAVTSRLQLRIQREADLGFNEKLFAKMTVEATTSLDEIARLSSAAIGTRAPSDL